MTGKWGNGGSLNLAPTSEDPNGSMRGASAAMPSPAITAAVTAATPPPTKTSLPGIAAASSNCAAIVNPIEVAKENWSLGLGLAQYA